MQQLVTSSWKTALLLAAITATHARGQGAPPPVPSSPGTETAAPAVGNGYLGVYIEGAAEGGGVALAEIVEHSPAAKAGLKAGDVIVALGDRTIASEEDLRSAIASIGAGAKVKVTFLRDGEKRRTSARLGSPPDEAAEGGEIVDQAPVEIVRLNDAVDGEAGVAVRRAPEPPAAPNSGGPGWLGVQLEPTDGGGASVLSVVGGSPAEAAGLEAGDVITRVDGDDISNIEALVSVIGSHQAGDKVRLVLIRGGEEKKLKVALGVRQAVAEAMGGGDGGMVAVEPPAVADAPKAPARMRLARRAAQAAAESQTHAEAVRAELEQVKAKLLEEVRRTNEPADLSDLKQQFDGLRLQIQELRARCEQQQKMLDAVRAALGREPEPQPPQMPGASISFGTPGGMVMPTGNSFVLHGDAFRQMGVMTATTSPDGTFVLGSGQAIGEGIQYTQALDPIAGLVGDGGTCQIELKFESAPAAGDGTMSFQIVGEDSGSGVFQLFGGDDASGTEAEACEAAECCEGATLNVGGMLTLQCEPQGGECVIQGATCTTGAGAECTLTLQCEEQGAGPGEGVTELQIVTSPHGFVQVHGGDAATAEDDHKVVVKGVKAKPAKPAKAAKAVKPAKAAKKAKAYQQVQGFEWKLDAAAPQVRDGFKVEVAPEAKWIEPEAKWIEIVEADGEGAMPAEFGRGGRTIRVRTEAPNGAWTHEATPKQKLKGKAKVKAQASSSDECCDHCSECPMLQHTGGAAGHGGAMNLRKVPGRRLGGISPRVIVLDGDAGHGLNRLGHSGHAGQGAIRRLHGLKALHGLHAAHGQKALSGMPGLQFSQSGSASGCPAAQECCEEAEDCCEAEECDDCDAEEACEGEFEIAFEGDLGSADGTCIFDFDTDGDLKIFMVDEDDGDEDGDDDEDEDEGEDGEGEDGDDSPR